MCPAAWKAVQLGQEFSLLRCADNRSHISLQESMPENVPSAEDLACGVKSQCSVTFSKSIIQV